MNRLYGILRGENRAPSLGWILTIFWLASSDLQRAPFAFTDENHSCCNIWSVSCSGVLGSLDNLASFWRSLLMNSEPQPGPHPDHWPPSIPTSALSRAEASPLTPVVASVLHRKCSPKKTNLSSLPLAGTS